MTKYHILLFEYVVLYLVAVRYMSRLRPMIEAIEDVRFLFGE